jgi:mono/diheme cytochrome c family protein
MIEAGIGRAHMPLVSSIGVLLAVALAMPAGTQARDSGVHAVSGAHAYRTYCASCHGVDGRGEGPLAETLRFHPPDLSLLAKRNGGEYPAEKVHRIVDGRKPLPGHGGPDMPIWGDAFRNAETGYDDAQVRERIRSVVAYLRTLQAPAKK